MQEITWQSVVPQFTQFEQHIENYASIVAANSPSKIQFRLNNAIRRIMFESHFPRLLLLVAPDVHEYFELVNQMVTENLPSLDNPIICAENFTEIQLFGALYPSLPDLLTQSGEQNVTTSPTSHKVEGLLHQANGGVLILSLTHLLQNHPRVWNRLKTTLSTGRLEWKSAKADVYCKPEGFQAISTRVIIIGDRGLMSDFEDLEPCLHSISSYCEYEQDVRLSNENIDDYLSMIKYFQMKFEIKPLTSSAIRRVMEAGVRFCEDHDRMPLCPLWYQMLLREADFQSSVAQIDEIDIQKAITEKRLRESYLPLRVLDDIHNGQVVIDTSGEKIGQVNGLTVIEMSGHPMVYGEPARISCVVHFGDGDITDVERKVELAGNIHAKGMMIMQAFIHAALDLDEPLPFSASIVFEQSYCEVDGDSASLAELCAFVSALSLQPINQGIAITGAVDQFGRVQAVGGINEKIEGFYHICDQRGLTGTQGVILPKANLRALCLNYDLIESIKAGQFHLWAVEDIEQVFPLIMGMAFSGNESDDEETLLDKMIDRIETFHHAGPRYSSLMNKVKNWFNPN